MDTVDRWTNLETWRNQTKKLNNEHMVSKFNSLYAPAFFATAIDHSLSMFPSIFLQKCQGKQPKDPRPMGSSVVTGSVVVVVVVVVADVVVAVAVRGEHTTCSKPLCHFHQVG